MEITPAHKSTARRDLTIIDSILNVKLFILPGNKCKTGTPLIPGNGGWKLARKDDTPLYFAAGPTDGGENVMCFKAGTLETHVPDLPAPCRVSISDATLDGGLVFTPDPDGLYQAITKSRVLLA